jgi:hypothetical protein
MCIITELMDEDLFDYVIRNRGLSEDAARECFK